MNRNSNHYINIKFQTGAIDKEGVNGCQVEDVISVLVEKLKSHQNGDFACPENSLAISNLQSANFALRVRKERLEEKNQGNEYVETF
ncbi:MULTISPECIES: hypothetical protein [Metabacillus]|jgi:hypothetical protein|uniref:Acb2/Tad1 hairpin domain-containing protein n=3 Tax=Metabacillus TaxID=2675233 RepID=A0A179SY44_9BACI|nr:MULTISPECIES: hypothetical protein [Metabacillus]OAS86294.1 hypothetical protein A6K24_21475 [Metabacillus litoralis]QNF30628.1 hypothetical protein HUW50_26060 [Metabacillus sp. KUDC1714]